MDDYWMYTTNDDKQNYLQCMKKIFFVGLDTASLKQPSKKVPKWENVVLNYGTTSMVYKWY